MAQDNLDEKIRKQQEELEKREKNLRAREEALKQQTKEMQEQQQKANSIDDTVSTPSKKTKSIDDKTNDGFSFKKFGKDLLKFSPLAAGIYYTVQGTFTPLMTMAGFALGNLWEKIRDKKKFNYKNFKKDMYTSGGLGATDYWFWKMPDIIPNSTFIGKMAKTAFALGVLAPPYLYGFNQYLYFRDNVGLKKTVKGLFTGEIFQYLKEGHAFAKKRVWKQLKDVLLITPTYFVGLNYLKNMYHRIGISVFNNLFLKLMLGRGEGRYLHEKIGKKLAKPAKALKNVFYDAPKKIGKKIADTSDKYFTPSKSYRPQYGT